MRVEKQLFGDLNGEEIFKYKIENNHGFSVSCLNYGCVITDIFAPDRNGNIENVVLGFDHFDDYLHYSPYFGAVVGRFAGRIKDAEFELEGKTYSLLKNDRENHLHGGKNNFSHVIWDAKIIEEENKVGVQFTYFSADGEEGYPGNLEIVVSYMINNHNDLIISYHGVSDQKTLVNMTNHSYFNLSGNLKRDILNHELTLDSNQFLELNEDLIPTGVMVDVNNTPFDFREGQKISVGTHSSHPQNVLVGKGYDHPFLLNKNHNREIVLSDEESGRKLIIETNEVAVVLYTANQLEPTFSVRGIQSRNYMGVCLEVQGLPDSIHHPNFPTNVLDIGQTYHSTTTYSFGVIR